MRNLKLRLSLIPKLLMLSCLTLLLTSCAHRLTRPSDYLQDCHITYLTAEPATVKDVVAVGVDREADLDNCNADKAALRAWFDKAGIK